MRNVLAACFLVLAGCTDSAEVDTMDDAAAEAAPLSGKADGDAALTGLYATASTTLADGDIPNLELLSGGAYVRARCYHAGCSARRTETDRFDTFTSGAGKTYIRFWSFKIVPNTVSGDRDQVPTVADTYEIIKTSTTIKLRKTYSSRWVSLRKRAVKSLCTTSGGTWTTECACPGSGTWPGTTFIAGGGGCQAVSGTDESECDDSNGFYTDDDATLIGSYCECGIGRYASDTGCAAN